MLRVYGFNIFIIKFASSYINVWRNLNEDNVPWLNINKFRIYKFNNRILWFTLETRLRALSKEVSNFKKVVFLRCFPFSNRNRWCIRKFWLLRYKFSCGIQDDFLEVVDNYSTICVLFVAFIYWIFCLLNIYCIQRLSNISSGLFCHIWQKYYLSSMSQSSCSVGTCIIFKILIMLYNHNLFENGLLLCIKSSMFSHLDFENLHQWESNRGKTFEKGC